jgi:signal transduction histidine kinase
MAQEDRDEGSWTREGLPGQASLAVENLRLGEALDRAKAANEEFVDLVAHQLKQPITAAKGYTQLLLLGMGGELAPVQRQFLDVIAANVERMGMLVNDLLEVCRLEAGRIGLTLAPVSLGEVLDEALVATRAEVESRHHDLEVDTPQDLPPVLADRERLVQVLAHLLQNACRYTPDGGRIEVLAQRQKGRVAVRVVDSGIGLSAGDMRRLGEKFFRGEHPLVQSQPGNGLGLAIARRLVALHGGELRVESEPGRGSTFAFTLPAANGRR